MLRQCLICKEVKLQIFMYSHFVGLYTEVYPICRSCANKLKYSAVVEWMQKLEPNK